MANEPQSDRPKGLYTNGLMSRSDPAAQKSQEGDSFVIRNCASVEEPKRKVAAAEDAISSHPLLVRPLGNRYLSSGPNAKESAGGFRRLPDEILNVFLEYLQPRSLRVLGYTCRFFFAFCHSDDLWKSLFLESEYARNSSVIWKGSWRSTLLQLPGGKGAVVDCSHVFSDILHRPFLCSQINLSHFTENIPEVNQISRFENLAYFDFAENWSEKPFILTNCIRDWPAFQEWNLEYFSTKHRHVGFRAESVDWTFEAYEEYMRASSDESPLYLFDRKFAEKMGIVVGQERQEPGAAYWKPACFGPDLFEVLGKERPAHRWLIIGPQRSGSTFHKDPNATSAWNAVIQGAKYWIMFPPDVQVPGVYVSSDSSEVTSPLSIAEWLLEFQAEARQLPECFEGICKTGEILHVPSGWWHLVVNLEAGIALTQNFVPKSPSLHHLAEAIAFLRDKPDQVTGFKPEVEDPYKLFAQRLREKYPDLLSKALGVIERKKKKKEGKKRKWDAAIGVGEEGIGGSGGSFNFGFGADDEIP